MLLNWKATKEEHELFSKIADRGMDLAGDSPGFSKWDLMMDVQAVHCNGCPLKLVELLEAPGFDFAHDLGGIRRHLDRETGKLRDCFLPRFAVPASEREAVAD